MNFIVWKKWYKQLPFTVRWFVLLVLFRPIIDQFYFLKEISPIVSPLYIVGILTPILVLFSFLGRSFPYRIKSIKIDMLFGVFSILLLLNLSFLFLLTDTFEAMSGFLRYSLPIFLFLYLRNTISSKMNLIGILQTILYSAYIPAILLGYEFVFGSLNAEFLNESRGGGERMQGGYADIMNYAIYISSALIIKAYFFFRSKKYSFRKKHFKELLLVMIVCFLGLIAIKQTVSWLVFGYLFILFMGFNLKSKKGVMLITLLTPLLILIAITVFESKIEPLVKREYAVIEGEKDVGRAFNGRASRWIYYFGIYNSMPLISNVFGTTTSLHHESQYMISGLMHNEFIRVLFLTGMLGLLFYLLFLFGLFQKIKYLDRAEKFLGLAAIGSFLIFSFTTSPLIYAPYLYFILPIFAYLALPKFILKRENEKK